MREPICRRLLLPSSWCRLSHGPRVEHKLQHTNLNPMNMNPIPQNCSLRKTSCLRCHPVIMMCSLLALLLITGTQSSLLAAPITEVVVKTGDKAPDKDGTFD